MEKTSLSEPAAGNIETKGKQDGRTRAID